MDFPYPTITPPPSGDVFSVAFEVSIACTASGTLRSDCNSSVSLAGRHLQTLSDVPDTLRAHYHFVAEDFQIQVSATLVAAIFLTSVKTISN